MKTRRGASPKTASNSGTGNKKRSAEELEPQVTAQPDGFPIVAIGASAGGLESFIQLLNQLPSDTGLALIFVQHLDPTHPSLSTDILRRATQMPVTEIRDGEPVEPNHIYALPSNYDLSIQKAILKLQPRSHSRAPHKTIDTFFQSLAGDQGPLAIGVVLSGTATDGTEGLRAIKAEGGITFAQTPTSAKYDGMPRAAIEAKVVDLILPPSGIAEELVRIATHLHITLRHGSISSTSSLRADENSKVSRDALGEIISLLRRQKNVDFSEYKQTTVSRRIIRRMVILKLPTEKAYASFLKEHPEEIKTLFSELLIHVTGFFRDPKAFAALKQKVFAQIIKNHTQGSPIRVWVPACSSGEEAYSIAISLLDYLGENISASPIQIFASDISETAIQKARQGLYPEASVQNLPAIFLQRYFTKSAGGYKLNKSVRDLCLFSKHDVISDPPFAKVDLISCRNLLIYFTSALQKRAIPLFHYALNSDGFLFLGHSETIGEFSNLFRTVDKHNKIYEKKPAVNLPRVHFTSGNYASEKAGVNLKKALHPSSNFDTQKEVDHIVALKYGPSGVVVNDDLEILHFRGRTVPYLEQPAGLANHRLLKMAHPDLGPELRAILRSAKSQIVSMRKDGIRFENDGQVMELNIEVVPINPGFAPKERQYLILFEKVNNLKHDQPPAENLRRGGARVKLKKSSFDPSQAEQRIAHLEQQLASSKEYQQALGEDHEATREEVTAANEELQSANEELQSTNEELETAKEELQSTNEELITVNEELQSSNTELGTLNNDLINLLGSIKIPIVIVGGDHRIRRFTPTATKLLNLIPTDIGRPIQDIRSNLNLSNLDSLISEVMVNLRVKELEVQDQKNHWFRLQIHPYKTTDNRIDGAVLAFVDIEGLKLALGQLKGALDYATAVADALQIPSIVMDRNLRIKSVNQLFCKIFEISAPNTEGRLLTELGNKNWNVSELKKRLEDTIHRNEAFQDFEVSGHFSGIGHRTFLLSAKQIQWAGLPEPESILLALLDITDRKQIELAAEKANRAKDVFLATLSHELRTPLSSILTWAQLIQRGKVDFEKAKVGAAIIEQSAKTQSQLIDDLLDISRIVSGKLALNITEVNPGAMITIAVEAVRSMGEKKLIQIETALSSENGIILADPIRLQQIIWNLLTNAVKFSPKNSRIGVRLEYTGDQMKRFAQIEVIDQGKGISPEFLPYIFNRFSQADSTSTRVHGGLGLGLSIVRSLVELQGGSVRAENSATGKGAIFTIVFPLTSPNGAIIQPAQQEKSRQDFESVVEDPPSLEGLRILVVDDDDSTRDSLTIYLKSFGAEVIDADSASEALMLLPDFKPHILVSDIAMPYEDGYSLIRKIRSLNQIEGRDLPALALTAYASDEDGKTALAAGFQAHIAKPVEAYELARAIFKFADRQQKW